MNEVITGAIRIADEKCLSGQTDNIIVRVLLNFPVEFHEYVDIHLGRKGRE